MQMPGPFQIQRVVEFLWPAREPGFLLRDVTAADFATTRTSRDERFVDPQSGLLIMSFHSFVVQTGAGTLLVDTCVGNHKDRPIIPEWHQQEFPYLERLGQAGLRPEDIDFVCCTHLHADHVGWNTRLDNGRWVPTFPNARYVFAAAEIEFWEQYHLDNPGDAYYRPWSDSVLPVLDANRAQLVASDHEIADGIRLQPAPGHTPGNVVIELDDGKQRAVMSGDVIHHAVQIERPEWSANFDGDPDAARITRLALLERLADTGTVLLPAHFSGPTAVGITSDSGGFFYHDV
jgi:glyoxylase-like metal-dependent hydrolase (beta-lactamase superfamily II)